MEFDDGPLVPVHQFNPGYHFLPTDEELVDVYLRAKIEGRPRPLDAIVELESILDYQPHVLVGTYKRYGENRWFFFTKRTPSSSKKANEPCRKLSPKAGADVEGGLAASWKATGSVVEIRRSGDDEDGRVIGTKRILIYHSIADDECGKWSMNEFILADYPGMDQWVLCAVQIKQHWVATSPAHEEATLPDGSVLLPPPLTHEQNHRDIRHNDTNLIAPSVVSPNYEENNHAQALQGNHQEPAYDLSSLLAQMMKLLPPDDHNLQYLWYLYHLNQHNALLYQDAVDRHRQLSAHMERQPDYILDYYQPQYFIPLDFHEWQKQQQQQQQVACYTDQLEMQRFAKDVDLATSQVRFMSFQEHQNHMVEETSPDIALAPVNSNQIHNNNHVGNTSTPTVSSNYYGPSIHHESSSNEQTLYAGDPNADGAYQQIFSDYFQQ